MDKEAFQNLLATVKQLRAPDGCPWDKEQTTLSLRPFLIEEAYETVEVMDQIKSASDFKNPSLKNAFIEEWGDVLLQILLNAEIASETDPEININTIVKNLNEKLIRRHPHVFGETVAKTSHDVIKNWDQIKQSEKASSQKSSSNQHESILAKLATGLPPLPRTMKIINRVTKVGFQWPDLKGPLDKLDEEIKELKAELTQSKDQAFEYLDKIEGEIGDVLFSICNIAFFCKIDPESALRKTLRKFESRFGYVEARLFEKNIKIENTSLAEMDQLWDEAKKIERGQ